MDNIVIFGKEARQKIKEGVDLIANPVKVTLGAKGLNVMCVRDLLLPIITKDGVSVAKEVAGNDPIVNAGASLVKQVASQTNELAGDGTTSSTVLAQAIVNEADKVLNEGANAISLKRGLDLALDFSVKHLKKLAINSNSAKTLKNIAKISTNGDKEISDLVTKAITKVGKNGTIKVEETEEFTSNVITSKGYEIDTPYVHTGFINSPQTFEAIFEDMNVLIYSGKIKEPSQLNKAIQLCSKELEDGKSEFTGLLVICNNIEPIAQKEILENKHRGFKIMNITSPSFNNKRLETLKDIAALIGARVYVEDLGESLNDITLEGLGKIDKVVSDANKTVLIGGKGETEEIDKRIKVVTEQVKTITGGPKETQFVKERLSKLKNGVAVINVGGYSAVEKREKTDRVEDALCAVRACLEEGYVAGGGVTYLNVAQALRSAKLNTKNQDEEKGVEVLIKALYAPFTQILTNAGTEESLIRDIIISIEESPYGHGINLETEKFTDLIKEGIIDPAKVSRIALQNAVSISSTFLTMGAITYNSESIFNNAKRIDNI